MSTQTVSIGADEAIEVEQVGGDLRVTGWDRQDLQARGDAIRVERRTGAVAVSCGGDLVLSVPRNTHLTLSSIGGNLQVEHVSGSIELGLVGGDATLHDLGGSVRLSGMIGGETHLENVADLSMSSSRAGGRFDIAERVRRKVEQATRRAESQIRRAERRGFQVSQMRWNQGRGVHWDSDAGGVTSASSESVATPSDEERMAILKMLQDRKITSEQAENLLRALEGNA